MQKKNLRRTDGMPLYLGVAAAVLLLIYYILQSGPSSAYTQSLLAQKGATTGFNPMTLYIGYAVSFLIYPGIFLILLLLGAKKPRRGSAFAILWLVVSAAEIVSSVYSLVSKSKTTEDLKAIAAAMVPGGFYFYAALGLVGIMCILVSCIVLLKRLHTPEPAAENGADSVQLP